MVIIHEMLDYGYGVSTRNEFVVTTWKYQMIHVIYY